MVLFIATTSALLNLLHDACSLLHNCPAGLVTCCKKGKVPSNLFIGLFSEEALDRLFFFSQGISQSHYGCQSVMTVIPEIFAIIACINGQPCSLDPCCLTAPAALGPSQLLLRISQPSQTPVASSATMCRGGITPYPPQWSHHKGVVSTE